MTVREYLKDCNKYADVTFIKARAREDAHTPGYHAEYQTTPIRTLVEWEKSNLMDYYILNDKQCPIDWLSGTSWKFAFDNGRLISLLVISKEDLETLYSKEQAASMIEYIGKKIKSR